MEESCANCARCLNLEILDYSQGGCKHTKVTDEFICLAFADEGVACLMHGTSKNDVCECWADKNKNITT